MLLTINAVTNLQQQNYTADTTTESYLSAAFPSGRAANYSCPSASNSSTITSTAATTTGTATGGGAAAGGAVVAPLPAPSVPGPSFSGARSITTVRPSVSALYIERSAQSMMDG